MTGRANAKGGNAVKEHSADLLLSFFALDLWFALFWVDIFCVMKKFTAPSHKIASLMDFRKRNGKKRASSEVSLASLNGFSRAPRIIITCMWKGNPLTLLESFSQHWKQASSMNFWIRKEKKRKGCRLKCLWHCGSDINFERKGCVG